LRQNENSPIGMSRGLSEKRRLGLFAALLFVSGLAPLHFFSQIREIGVKIIADEEFRKNPVWKSRAENCLNTASADFERLFGIRILVKKFEDWSSGRSAKSWEALAEDLDAHLDKENIDILLAFTAQRTLDKSYTGYSVFREGIILLKDTDDMPLLTKTLKHELGHIFGGVHVADPGSIMDYFSQGDNFDTLNAQVISLNRERLFNTVDFPIPKKNRLRAVDLYEQIARSIQMTLFQDKTDEDLQPAIKEIYAQARILGVLGEDGRRDPFYLDDAWILLAQLYLETKQVDKAMQACQAALKISPKNLETQNIMGIALRRKGLVDQAIEKYKSILEEKPNHSRVLYNLGIAYSKNADFESVQLAYEKAIELKPNFAEAHNNLGEMYLRLGKAEDAEKEFLLAASIGAEFPLAHSNLAEVYCRKKDYDKAKAEAEKSIAMNPELPDPYNILGNIDHQQGKTEEAIEKYHQALSLDPGYEKAYFNLGLCYFDRNQLGDAKNHFSKALEINKNFPEAHASLGYCLLRENKTDEAIAEIKLGQMLGFRSAKTYTNLSFAYLQKGMTDQAIEEAERAIELDPGQAAAFNNLGIAYMKKRMLPKAAEQFQKAIETDQNNKEAFFNLGSLLFQAGKLDQALDLYLTAAKLDPNNGALFNNIAVVYFRKGEYGLAWEYVQKAQAAGFKVQPAFLDELKKKKIVDNVLAKILAFDGKINLLSDYPRLEIVEIDEDREHHHNLLEGF
jgi:tetratricopeptide (TPR) repeat protein